MGREQTENGSGLSEGRLTRPIRRPAVWTLFPGHAELRCGNGDGRGSKIFMRKSDASFPRPASDRPGAAGPSAPFRNRQDRRGSAGRDGRRGACRVSAFQWRRGGVDIPGATGSDYLPGPEDDLALVSCRVTAPGSAPVATSAIRITRAPPVVSGALREEAFGEDGGDWTVETAGVFSGRGPALLRERPGRARSIRAAERSPCARSGRWRARSSP